MGHANNACHVVRCEQRAWRHSESLGLSIKNCQRLDRGVAICKATYEYSLPAFENENLLIATWLTACDGKFRPQRRFKMINVTTEKTAQRSYWSGFA